MGHCGELDKKDGMPFSVEKNAFVYDSHAERMLFIVQVFKLISRTNWNAYFEFLANKYKHALL